MKALRSVVISSLFLPISIPILAAPPTRVVDLRVSVSAAGQITAYWTAPSTDAAMLVEYDVRLSTDPYNITSINWPSRQLVNGEPIPGQAGTTQGVVISGLPANTKYYIGLKTRNAVNQWSLLSNVPSVNTGSATKSVTLSWTWTKPDGTPDPPAPGFMGVIACQSKVQGSYTNCKDVGIASSYTFTELIAGSRDWFGIAAYYDSSLWPTYAKDPNNPNRIVVGYSEAFKD